MAVSGLNDQPPGEAAGFGARRGAEVEVIRQEDQGAVLVGVVHLDSAQPVRAFRRGVSARQLDDLVPEDGAALGHPAPLDHLVHGVVLQAGDEERLLADHVALDVRLDMAGATVQAPKGRRFVERAYEWALGCHTYRHR